MASASNLRSRRSAAQLHALAGVQREIRANDQSGRRKYLREFSGHFRSYQNVLETDQLQEAIFASDVVLIGDYHALPASQRYAASLLEERAQPADRPVVLGVETIFARDQHIIDEWWRREIDEQEFRQRIRFDLDWNYEWAPFYELLATAREHGEAIYGLDCMPREDLRRISARDRHAAHKIAEIRQRHPRAVVMVLFGESHLAPAHLPRALRQEVPADRVLTILQNVDALYWRAAGEQHERVEAVQVKDNVVCVFNSTPLEKYESYRLCFTRWNREAGEQPDVAPTIYNLIDSLLRFLDINRYASHNGTQPKFLVDLMPEVYCGNTDGRLRQLLLRATGEEKRVDNMLQKVEAQGSVYLPSINAFYLREFHMAYVAEEASRFLHHACRGLPLRRNGHPVVTGQAADRFYARTLEHALAYFGSRVLYPARLAVRIEDQRDLSRASCEEFLQQALHGDRAKFDSTAQHLGYALGSELYDAYLRGVVSQKDARRFFLAHIEEPGAARAACLDVIRRTRTSRKKPCASVR
jgi:hypothetical protein